MKWESFLYHVLSNILQIQYLIKNAYINNVLSLNASSQQYYDNHITLNWMLDHLGTRGNYPNHQFDDNTINQHGDPINIDYNIEQIQLIIRHGSRYPVLGGMTAIKEALKKLNESRNHHLIGWIKSFKNEYLDSRTGELSEKGQHEVFLIGKRLAKNYPQFILSLIDGDVISSSDFQAFTSWSSRTSQSGQAFCIGAFEALGGLGPAKLMSVPILTLKQKNDSLIAMEKACPRWKMYAKKTVSKYIKPLSKTYLEPIAKRMTDDLGINITMTDVENFYDACTTEISMHRRADTFCKLFIRDDVIKLEFIDDLNHYYKHSYGLMDLNEDLACDLGKFILESIEKRKFKLDIKFGHSETTLPLRTFLGLYKDEPLLSSNSTEEQVRSRLFKMSNFGYFANNIAFQVLSHKSNQEQYVRVLDNEKPILLPGCNDILCPIDQFEKYMKSRIRECNFIEFCKIKPSL